MNQHSKTLRILVVDDHEVVRRGVRGILKRQRRFQIVGEASNGMEALKLAAQLKPDVAVMDIEMPQMDGLAATRKMKEVAPRTHVLVFTVHESDEYLREALEAGARGLVMKSDMANTLGTAVTALGRGEVAFTPKVAEIMVKGFVRAGSEARQVRLTYREEQIVRLLAAGKANKEVSDTLGVTLNTAETYRSRIMAKLNMHSVTELTRFAVRQNLINA
jgi:DNA-binding NarL/FixJ family response regulator